MRTLSSLIIFAYLSCVLAGGGRKSNPTSRHLETIYQESVTNLTRSMRATDATCPFSTPLTCDPTTKYRTIDGACNNLINPYYGKANTPLTRVLPPVYADGLGLAKTSGLPNPRTISTTFNSDNKREEAIWSHIYTTFGQFLTHDLVETGVSFVAGGCDCSTIEANCLPIKMPAGDTVMKSECITFTRSSATLPLDCASNQREQLNLVTAYIDGSQVYGSGASASAHLRTFKGGELATSAGLEAGRDYLPKSDQVCSAAGSKKCFESGDHRTTENLGLSGMHTLFLREHNRLARELAKVNPAWSDETLFQETKRIVVAILQHITYSQYVPGTIGFQNLDAYQIRPKSAVNSVATYFTGYNSSVNPQLTNEFATAALRFGHSVVSNSFARFNKDDQEIDNTLTFSDINFKAEEAYNSEKGGIDSIVVGLVNTMCGKLDLSIASDLQNKLMYTPAGHLLDLAAVNIQRGRDHGLPGYTAYVKRCLGIDVKSFSDLAKLKWPGPITTRIQRVYSRVEDIDLWFGLLSETVDRTIFNADVLTGPTLTCLLAEQFQGLKTGDRFFYENAPDASKNTEKTAFTVGQLNEIKKVSLSTLLCNNFAVAQIQPDVFFIRAGIRPGNFKKACSSYAQIDLTKWKA